VTVVFHKAVDVSFLEETKLEMTFQDGSVKQYDMASLFPKYPQLQALEDRRLFLSGKLMGGYGIIWNDDLDIDAETIYEDGITVRIEKNIANESVASAISVARAKAGLSQKQVAAIAGMDQSDFSKIERGMTNPSILTLERIAKAMGGKLTVNIEL
jgi:DNA-binding XRE family transcriptional regulator